MNQFTPPSLLAAVALLSLTLTAPAQACLTLPGAASPAVTACAPAAVVAPAPACAPARKDAPTAAPNCALAQAGLLDPRLVAALGEMAAGGMQIAAGVLRVLSDELGRQALRGAAGEPSGTVR